MKWIHQNPELTRNLWLEITPQRLLAAPAILALLCVVTWVGSDSAPWKALAWLGAAGFLVMTVLWGAKQASDALSDEFSQGTWDAQRGSGLSAGQMVFGKLFGGAGFAWYAGFCCLAPYLLGGARSLDAASLLRGLVGLLAAALLLQSLALLSTLLAWRKLRQVSARQSRGVGLIFAFIVLPNLATLLIRSVPDDSTLRWFGQEWLRRDFYLVSLVMFAGWALLGVHRAMRSELQFRNRPWTWIAFVLFLQGYVAGFVPELGADETLNGLPALAPTVLRIAVVALLPLLFAYGFLFSERKDPIRFARLVAHMRAGRRDRVIELAPFWAVNLALALLTGLVALVAALFTGAHWMDLVQLLAGLAAVLLFAVRDVALVLWCNFGKARRRADAAAMAYLAVLYALLPALLFALELHGWLGLVLPWISFAQPFWLIAAAAWAAAGLDLLHRRWKEQVESLA